MNPNLSASQNGLRRWMRAIWLLVGICSVAACGGSRSGGYAPAAGIAVTFTATATATHACGAAGGTDQSPPNTERIATSNETWTAAGSPHRGFQVTFSDGAVFTVEPGATVCVDELEFLNGGRLVAVGTATDRILFSSGQGAPSWAGIFLFPQFGAPSLIRFADIENPRYFSVGIHALGISDTRLVRTVPASAPICPQWLLHLAAGTRVERVVVERFGGNGCPALVVSTDDTYSPPGTTFSISARLLASAGDAIHTSLGRQLVLSNCEISGSAGDGLVSLEAGVFAPSIGGCSIVDNLGVGVRNEEPIRQVAAQGNWWGDAAGPGGPTGDGVAGDVDASNPSAAPVTLGY